MGSGTGREVTRHRSCEEGLLRETPCLKPLNVIMVAFQTACLSTYPIYFVTNFTHRSINNVLSDDVTLIKYFNK